ncbi:MAG: DUF5946 family protein [bacterium]
MDTEKNRNHQQQCPGCQAWFPKKCGPTHPYIGSSPGCWAAFGEVTAKECTLYQYPSIHRLTVDTYAVQHPGVPSEKAIRSVGIHLSALHLYFEEHFKLDSITKWMGQFLSKEPPFFWLDPPQNLGKITILDVAKASFFDEHVEVVHNWSTSVWEAWAPHHKIVRRWCEPFI